MALGIMACPSCPSLGTKGTGANFPFAAAYRPRDFDTF
jgi:hypothetical protein